jgi:four helix bundle protein
MNTRGGYVEHRTSNIEHRTSNESGKKAPFDLEERLLQYAARVIRLSSRLPRDRSGNHIAKQFLRSGTSPLGNHAEAQSAESPADFIHKLRVCLKELRESHRWLRLIHYVPMVKNPKTLMPLLDETDQLIRIFVTSLRTAERRACVPS